LTAVAIIYSRWGQRSGAHLNPAVTLTFWRMGKVKAWDAVFYVTAQFAGASIGVAVAAGSGSARGSRILLCATRRRSRGRPALAWRSAENCSSPSF